MLAPLRLEALALRRGLCDPGSSVVRTGMGPARAKAAAERLATDRYRGPFAVAGVCGGVDPALRPGDVVVASALRTADGGEHELAGAEVLANAVRKLGLTCVTGTILSVERLERTARRAASGHAGIVGVDMESAWLAAAAGDGPLTVLRVVADAGGRSVYSPRTLLDGALALRALRRAAPALEEWARASGPRTILLAGPRSFCAGVERAIEVVERALGRRGAPIYVRKKEGTQARLIEDHTGLDPAGLSGKRTIGLTAGASAPERLVRQVIDELAGLGPVAVEDRMVAEESIQFNLPREVT